MKTSFISQLPSEIQNAIKSDLIKSLSSVIDNENELTETMERAMSSRLCDLADTIKIKKYL